MLSYECDLVSNNYKFLLLTMGINNFNLLRLSFAFIVLLRHIVDLSKNTTLSYLESYFNTYICITGFFVISGCLIWRSYSNALSTKEYLIKRANRLLPAYIFFVFTAAMLLSAESNITLDEYFISEDFLKYLICNLFFLNFLQPCLPGVFTENWQCAVNGALWTIKVEVFFYLTVPLFFLLQEKLSNKFPLLAVTYFLSVLYKTIFSNLDGNLYYTLSKQGPGFLSYFVSGISFNYFYSFYWKNKNFFLIASFLIIFFEKNLKLEILTPFAFSMIIFQLAFRLKSFDYILKKVDISYGLYIYHFTVIQIFVSYSMFDTKDPYIISIVVILLVILLSLISWEYLEKPFLRKRI